MNIDKITTGIEDLIIYKNKVITDPRGSLLRLAHDIPHNSNFKEGVKNLIAVIAEDTKKPRGGHYHKLSCDETFIIQGTSLWYFLDMREGENKGKEYFCIVGSDCKFNLSVLNGIDVFDFKKDDFLAHIHIPSGVYHVVWSLDNLRPVVLIEAKTQEFDEADYVRIDPDKIPELVKFKEKYKL